jgi:bifunctional polynucleotide phosphatase/kinase
VNFFKPASQKQKEPEKVTWRIINNSLLIGKYQESQPVAKTENGQRQKIAAFDFVCNAGPWSLAAVLMLIRTLPS